MRTLLLLGMVVAALTTGRAAAGSAIPGIGTDDSGGPVFACGDRRYVFWGVDADTWACDAGNVDHFRKHCEASVYINANLIAVPITWKNVERSGPGKYDFKFVEQAIAEAQKHGLKVSLMWIGIDYAAGDPNFVPDYINADPGTYTRITGFNYDEQKRYLPPDRQPAGETDRLHCPSCPATLRREAAAYAQLMKRVAEVDSRRAVMAVNICGEIDYVRALDPATWVPERDVRCQCIWCGKARRTSPPESNVAFMTRQFANYVKTIIEEGARFYDIPVYSPVCSHKWFPGWRYAEDPVAFKAIINRANHFVCPSIAPTESEQAFVREEMDYFRPESISGNFIFVDGIDTGWGSNIDRLELAPWYSILHYGGLGAVYWDAPAVSIIKPEEPRRELLRRMWGPLKATQYYLARLKSGGSEAKFWWKYHETQSSGRIGEIGISQSSSDRDYGLCLLTGKSDLAIACTTFGGPATVTLKRAGGFGGFRFERGHFDSEGGKWRKIGEASAVVTGESASIGISGDSGDWRQAVVRVYLPGPAPASDGTR